MNADATFRRLAVAAAAMLLATAPCARGEPAPIPVDQLGAVATRQVEGEGLSITATPNGARLRCTFQQLQGEATPEGLWLHSTAGDTAQEPFRLVAVAVGREDSGFPTPGERLLGSAGQGRPPPARLASPRESESRPTHGTRAHSAPTVSNGRRDDTPRTGRVTVDTDLVRFLRPNLTEEYSVSVDGIRQDFVVAASPPGTGDLCVALALSGARATAAAAGATLTLDGSVRQLAYSRLRATDATGRELSARMEVLSPDRLVVRVDDSGATYPVRIDPTFSDADWVGLNPGFPGANGSIAAMATDENGNLYVGGIFTIAGSVAASRVARWDGSAWSALGAGMSGDDRPLTNPDAPWVLALAVSGTDLYAGGWFTSADGVTVNHVARWDGRTWSPLGAGVDGNVNALAVIGTSLYVGGEFHTAGGVPASRIARWDGKSWSALGSGVDRDVYALAAVGTDLYAGGEFTTAGGGGANHIARWDGSSWSALGPGMGYPVYALAAGATELYAGGYAWVTGDAPFNRVARWDGTSWSSFPPVLDVGRVNALALIGTELYVGGYCATSDREQFARVMRWNGSAWTTLGPGMDVEGEVSALAAIGTDLYVGGGFGAAGPTVADNIARWDGNTLSAVGTGIDATVYNLAVNGTELFVGCDIRSVASGYSPSVFRWDGNTWSTLGAGGGGDWGWFSALAVMGSNLYAGGRFAAVDGVPANNIARWDGSTWSALGAGVGSEAWHNVQALAVRGGDLYVAGDFDRAGGAPAHSIARWNGSAWSALGSGLTGGVDPDPYPHVAALAVSGTDLYAGGSFTAAGGVPASNIAKWNGSAWSALGSGMDGSVETLATMGTDLYAGGYFTTAGGMPANHIARWDGDSWSALGPGIEREDGEYASVEALAVSGTNLYAGGDFTTAGGIPASSIAKWDGNSWSALGSGVTGGLWHPRVSALAADEVGHLFVGGNFTYAGTRLSPFIAEAKIGAVPPTLHHFCWSPITSPQAEDAPFPITLTAEDFAGITVTSFTGTAILSGEADGDSSTTNLTAGDGTGSWEHPMYTYYHDARTQVIYLAEELAGACTLTSLALEATTPPGQTLGNWTIRLKHTALAEYPATPEWEAADWTVVYQADEPPGAAGWRTFAFSTPFAYNGADNLLVDFSFDNASYSSAGQCRCTEYTARRSIYYWTDSAYGDPLGWSEADPPPVRSPYVPNIVLGAIVSATVPVSLSPATAGPFVEGVWTGEATIADACAGVILRADDGLGHDGESNPFDVEAAAIDTDADGLPDAWELAHFPSLTNVTFQSDWDGDGFRDGCECAAGTSPTDPGSFLGITSVELNAAGTKAVIRWSSVSNRLYSVYGGPDLPAGLDLLLDNHLPATPPVNAYTDTVEGVAIRTYGVEVEP